jgi:RNA-directed DNA polymerase
VITRLVAKWLKAGVWENGEVSFPDKGTPQGGVISPLLSNIYLHEVLDEWFVGMVQPRCKERTFMVRFADDFIMGFEDLKDVEKVQKVIGQRFERFGLEINTEKTRLVRFGRPKSAKPGQGEKPETYDFIPPSSGSAVRLRYRLCASRWAVLDSPITGGNRGMATGW